MEAFIAFIKSCPLRYFAKGETLPIHVVESPLVWALQAGYVKVASIDATGNEQFLWIKSRLDIVPTERLFSRRPSDDFFYTALSDVAAYAVPKLTFIEQAQHNPHIMREIAISLSAHYDDLLTRVRATEEATARNKLIHTLYHISQKLSAEKIVHFDALGLHLNHHDLSQLIGNTRETTAVELKKLKDEGLISYTRSTFSVNTDKLARLL